MQLTRTTIDPLILSLIGIISPVISIIWIVQNFNLISISCLIIAAWIVGINTTIFAHRCWTHKSWEPSKFLNFFGLFLFTVTMIGNSIGWVSVHREHHRYSDTDKDPHSPHFKSRWAIQFLPYFNKVKIQYVMDLTRNKIHVWFAKNYWYIVSAWIFILFLIDTSILMFWFAVVGISSMKMLSINSFGHKTPKFLLPIGDCNQSTNSGILALLNINNGEAWHLNHHNDPANYRFGRKWYEVDPAARVIEIFDFFKVAKITDRVTAQSRASKY
jgi:stearoyl-CoA desaturase (delta-9 desaturase)